MLRLGELQPGLTDRAFLPGTTGSGKTTLAQYLLEPRPYVLALDTKGTLHWGKRWTVIKRFTDLRKSKDTHVIYRPPYADIVNEDAMESLFAYAWLAGNRTLYVDELAQITRGQIAPFHLQQAYQRGRDYEINGKRKYLSIWASAQRPSNVPTYCLTEAQAFFVFYLGNEDDRDRVETYTAIDADEIQALNRHQFLVAHTWDRSPAGPYKLTVPNTRHLRLA